MRILHSMQSSLCTALIQLYSSRKLYENGNCRMACKTLHFAWFRKSYVNKLQDFYLKKACW